MSSYIKNMRSFCSGVVILLAESMIKT